MSEGLLSKWRSVVRLTASAAAWPCTLTRYA